MPKIVDHEQFRSELLLQCFDLFARRGFNATTMRQIAKELDISTGTLYHYFPSKEALFNQMFTAISQRDEIQALETIANLNSIEARLAALTDFIVQKEGYFQRIIFLLFDYYQRHQSGQDDELIQQAVKRYQDVIMQIVGVDDPALGIYVHGFINGLMVLRIISGEAISLSEQCDLLSDLLQGYLSNKAEE